MSDNVATAIREYNDAELLQYLQVIENEGKHEEVMQMCILRDDWRIKGTTLMLALKFNRSTEAVLTLIKIGGKRLVMMTDQEYGQTILHGACGNEYNQNVSVDIDIDIVTELIRVGGTKLVMVKNLYSETALHRALTNPNVSMEVVSKLIEAVGAAGPKLVQMKNLRGLTALHLALCNTYRNASIDIVSKLIEVGGQKLVMVKDTCTSRTALHLACKSTNVSIEIISKLIKAVADGTKLLKMKDKHSSTALHYACHNPYASIDIVSKLIEVGGRNIVEMKDKHGRTAIHYACLRNANLGGSIDIVSKLIEVGGPELIQVKCRYGTALHCVCGNLNATVDVFSKLIEVGGPELIQVKCRYGTALHCVCGNLNATVDVFSKLIEVGGSELVKVKSGNDKTILHKVVSKLMGSKKMKRTRKNSSRDSCTIALHEYIHHSYCWARVSPNTSWCNHDILALLVKESILANIGGEFGIGGLFNVASQAVQKIIYEKWDDISLALESTLETLQQDQQPLPMILHAAILAKAPPQVIQGIANRFKYCVSKVDTFDRYPIELAFEEGLDSSQGLQEIVKATSMAKPQHPRIIHSAAQYGLKWRHHMKDLVEANSDKIMNGYDDLTGLRLFMTASMGESHDLSAIYGIMRMGPEMNI